MELNISTQINIVWTLKWSQNESKHDKLKNLQKPERKLIEKKVIKFPPSMNYEIVKNSKLELYNILFYQRMYTP
jgi:hypothetical protein